MADVPVINGSVHSYGNIEVKVDGAQYVSVNSISYKPKLTPGKLKGTHPQALGRTRGELEFEASMSLSQNGWRELLAVFGDGFLERAFDIVVTYTPSGCPMITDSLIQCRITEVGQSYSSGAEPNMVELTLDPMGILLNGVKPIADQF